MAAARCSARNHGNNIKSGVTICACHALLTVSSRCNLERRCPGSVLSRALVTADAMRSHAAHCSRRPEAVRTSLFQLFRSPRSRCRASRVTTAVHFFATQRQAPISERPACREACICSVRIYDVATVTARDEQSEVHCERVMWRSCSRPG